VSSEEYKLWWQLHLRIARGEVLRPDEKARYEAVLQDTDAAESLGALADAMNARQKMQALETEHSRLEERRRHLEQEIEDLERRLGQPARQLLTTQD
jgi:predicted nuclease with TOPRIM domain